MSGPATVPGLASALPLPTTLSDDARAILEILAGFKDRIGAAWLDWLSLTERARVRSVILRQDPDLNAPIFASCLVETRWMSGTLFFIRISRRGIMALAGVVQGVTGAGKSIFDGPALEPQDIPRLQRQLDIVRNAMRHGNRWTLAELAKRAGCSVASASARIRDLRKLKHGGWVIAKEREITRRGVFVYRRVCIPAGEES